MSFRLPIRVQPGARRSEIVAWRDGVLHLRVTAPPERGRATEAAIALVAEVLGIAKSRVHLVRGAASRDKLLAIEGVDEAAVRSRLATFTPGQQG